MGLSRRVAVLLTIVGACGLPAAARAATPVDSTVPLANACFTIGAHPGGPFFLKPTGLGTYLVYGADAQLLGRAADGTIGPAGPAESAGPATEWRIARTGSRAFSITPTAGGSALSTATTLTPASGCVAYPEAETGATGTPAPAVGRDGTITGFADDHVHITAYLRAGGAVISGEPFDRFGITRALGDDARDHGADGSLDITGNLLRDGVPFGTHDLQGWPSFTGWPTNDTNTHQQTYYVWLERAFRAGMRLAVAQTIEDDALCRIEPRRTHTCDEPKAIAQQIGVLKKLQDYVDAQSGGAGRGWFRLVYSPAQARKVIAAGRLAVLIGVESSNPFGCRIKAGMATCTAEQAERGLERYRALGVRSLFVTHWLDNSFSGAALEGGTKGKLINGMNRLETGHYFAAGRCPLPGQGEEPSFPAAFEIKVLQSFFPAVTPLATAKAPAYPKGASCNTRGLTSVGEALITRMMDDHMLIEVDHLSELARDKVLDMAEARHYPLLSSHNGTGGVWTPSELRRLYRLGGYAAATPAQAPDEIAKIRRLASFDTGKGLVGVGLGSDTGGFSTLPAKLADAQGPLTYPFTSHDGKVSFAREQTGTRTFDLNTDGVAHYGLFADLIADMQRRPGGPQALSVLFRSAEAYLQTWERAYR